MSDIIRRPDFAGGGITNDERRAMGEAVKLWTSRAFRTDPIEPEKITAAIKGIYAVSGLKEPRVVIVPSPLVMAFAYGASAAIWHRRAATDAATIDATDAATDAATRAATDAATYAATDAATYAATACEDIAGRLGLECAKRWWRVHQGGNMWPWWSCYLSAARDVLGLNLDAHAAYASWEAASIHGGFRVMHEKFCIVSDFPELIKVDDQNRPHCEDGPSHRWRDGWSLYHWHGVRIPAEWIEQREALSPREVLSTDNVEQRAAGCAIIGMAKMLDSLDHSIIDSSDDPLVGDLIEISLPGLPESELYLKFFCPRNGEMMEAVNKRELKKRDLHHAHAWHAGIPPRLFSYAQQRS